MQRRLKQIIQWTKIEILIRKIVILNWNDPVVITKLTSFILRVGWFGFKENWELIWKVVDCNPDELWLMIYQLIHQLFIQNYNPKRFFFFRIKLLKHIFTISLTQQQFVCFFFFSSSLKNSTTLKKKTISNAKQCTADNTCSVKKQQQEEMLVRHSIFFSILNLNIILGLFGNTWKWY